MKKTNTVITATVIFSLIFLVGTNVVAHRLYPPSELMPVWASIEPIQCQQNPWELATYAKNPKYTEKDLIKKYLNGRGIRPLKIEISQKYEWVCNACSCPRGDEIAVEIYKKDLEKIQNLGFTVKNPNKINFPPTWSDSFY